MKIFSVHLSMAVFGHSEVQATVLQLIALGGLAACIPRILASAPTTRGDEGGTWTTVYSALIIGGLLCATYVVQRRVASGLPLSYMRFSSYAASNAPTNVRRIGVVDPAAVQRPVAVVTGGNAGIGWWNALELSLLGYDVLLCCRSKRRAEEAIERILQSQRQRPSGGSVPYGVVTFVPLDLDDETSIRSAARAVLGRTAEGAHLRILINNAGMFSPMLAQRCTFGDEKLVGVNFSGVVLLTELIIRRVLQQNRMPVLRVVNVASIAHSWANVTKGSFFRLLDQCMRTSATDDVVAPPCAPSVNTYGFSKLLLLSYTRALADELRRAPNAQRVIIASVHPGAVLTEIFRELGVVASLMPLLLSTIFKKPAEGAETTLFAALSNVVRSGSYYADSKVMDAALSPLATDAELSQKLLERVRSRWGLQMGL